MYETKKHYFKDGIEFFLVESQMQKNFIAAFYGKRSKIVHSEEEAYAYFKIKKTEGEDEQKTTEQD